MSFGNDLRAKRSRSSGLVTGALMAALSLGGGMVSPSLALAKSSAPREYVAEQPTKKAARPTVTNRVKGAGRGIDSRKARRRILMYMAGRENTGRQWVRVRRAVRNGPAAPLLAMSAAQLSQIYEAGNRLTLRQTIVSLFEANWFREVF